MMALDPSQLSPAEKLLWSYGVTAPEHIDLAGIARDNNAEVIYRPLGGCEARLVAYEDRAIISVSTSSAEGRQRFSLAHELAHWICDRKTGSFQCAKEDIGPQNAEAKSVESAANGYASQLILPTYLVDPWIEGKSISLEVAAKLAAAFSTSLTAAAIKIVKRTEMSAVVTCHSQSNLIWHQRSRSFPYEFFVNRELHQDTEAFTIAFTGKGGMTRLKQEQASNWFRGGDAYRLMVESQSVKLPDGTVLTVVSVPPGKIRR